MTWYEGVSRARAVPDRRARKSFPSFIRFIFRERPNNNLPPLLYRLHFLVERERERESALYFKETKPVHRLEWKEKHPRQVRTKLFNDWLSEVHKPSCSWRSMVCVDGTGRLAPRYRPHFFLVRIGRHFRMCTYSHNDNHPSIQAYIYITHFAPFYHIITLLF
jgi:hypothetical protein